MSVDPRDIEQRDPKAVRRLLPLAALLHDRYFRCEFEGQEHLAPPGGAIYAGNHCGSTYTVEGMLLAHNVFARFGAEHPLLFFMHRAFFFNPAVTRGFLRLGAVLADRGVARKVLEKGGQFVVFPGGEYDSHKPFRERNKVCFYGHAGFIKMAIEERVPIVPFVHAGTHETLYVLSRGERLARALGLRERLGLNVFPLVLSFPFGLSLGPWFLAQPLPAKVQMRVLPPVRPWEHGWTDANDEAQLREALTHFETTMQRALDELSAARRPFLGPRRKATQPSV